MVVAKRSFPFGKVYFLVHWLLLLETVAGQYGFLASCQLNEGSVGDGYAK